MVTSQIPIFFEISNLLKANHLQLIKFWPSRAPGKGVCGGAKFLAPPYYSQRAVLAFLSAFLFFSRDHCHTGNAQRLFFLEIRRRIGLTWSYLLK